MKYFAWLLALALTTAADAAENSCTNGSFERLSPNGFAADWSAVGATVEVSPDAHSGKHALRLLRAADTKSPETGVNRGFRQGDGKQGRMLAELKGGIDFWYKAISADGAELNVYAIPMNDEPREGTRSRRATFTVPRDHVGDGQWHHARLKYDFTGDPKVKWVHVAARVAGTAGELLLDDVSYAERVGPILRFTRMRLEEDAQRPGQRCTLFACVENAGDEPAKDVSAKLALPSGLSTEAAEQVLRNLSPDEERQARWIVDGTRDRRSTLDLSAASGEVRTTASYPIAPNLVLRSFGPVRPVSQAGEPLVVECVLENVGSAAVTDANATFTLPSEESAPKSKWSPGDTGYVPRRRSQELSRMAARIEPGCRKTLAVQFTPRRPAAHETLTVKIGAANVKGTSTAHSWAVVTGADEVPAPSGRLTAKSSRDWAVLENGRMRLTWRRSGVPFCATELAVATPRGWRTVAWIPHFGRYASRPEKGHQAGLPFFFCEQPDAAVDAALQVGRVGFRGAAAQSIGQRESTTWDYRVTFTLPARSNVVSVRCELTARQPAALYGFDGPMLYVLDRDEAVFPGLEWLVDDELSSGTLDIAEGHPHQKRYVVHPNMVTIPAIGIHGRNGTVGLLWDVHQKWDGTRDRPSVVFASPDRLDNQRSHLMGLFLPSVPEFVEPNERIAKKPYPLKPGKPLVLECRIFADGEAKDALAAVDEWIRWKGLPEPAPLPHGSYEREVEFSMQAYLKSLWEPDAKEWWTTKGGGMMSQTGRPRGFVRDLLLGEVLSPDLAVRKACRDRADEVLGLIKGPTQLGLAQYAGRADLAMANPLHAVGLLASRDQQGAWRFDADQRHTTGPFVGRDYHELGPDNAVELGTCAQKAFQVLRYARIAGDAEAYRQMEKTLALMERFRVPRAAQVWEVPVHTPDVLAAADAVDAYLEAYRFSGDERSLRDAVTWARRGLPFIYLWNDPEKPFLVGGSIPVFGATWYRGSWFGRPVEWNGLRYANALLKLAEHDRSQDWRKIAELVIRSAIRQQDLDGPNVALWPDNISAIDGKKCPWVFAPRQILRNVLKLTGRDEDPATVIVGQGQKRLHVTAVGKIGPAAWDGKTLSLDVTYPKGEQGVVLVANVARPAAVLLGERRLAERPAIEQGPEPGWRYDAANAFLAVRVDRDGRSALRVEGAAFRLVHRLPWPVERIDFKLDDSPGGWTAAHDVDGLEADGRALVGRITGPDPYLVRGLLRVRGDDCPVLRLRMRVSAGQGGQLFWTTAASPQIGEDKSLRFAIQADGQFHEYRLEPGRHAKWAGQTITGLRIDPGGGARSGVLAIDYVRGAKE